MTIYQVLCVVSVPTAIMAVYKMMIRQIKDVRAQNDAIKLGLQALLRAQLIAD